MQRPTMSSGNGTVTARMKVAYGAFRERAGERGLFYFRRARVVCWDAALGGESRAVVVTVHEASEEDLRRLAAAMGRGPSDFLARRERGSVCLVARSGTEYAGCVWISRSAELMVEVHRVLDVSRDSQGAYLFDGFVLPAFRGRGILRALLGACQRWAVAHRLSRLYTAFTRENRVSERALRASGFATVVGDVGVVRVLGREWTWARLRTGAPFGEVLRTPAPSRPGSDSTRAPP